MYSFDVNFILTNGTVEFITEHDIKPSLSNVNIKPSVA